MRKNNTQISLHSVKNLLGEPQQLDLFSSHAEDFSKEYDTPIKGKIDRFGIDLTDIQSRVMEGILRGFSEAKYSQNLETLEKKQFCNEKFSGKIPPAYKNIKDIPFLRASQRDIISWAGIKKNSIGAWGRAVNSIEELGSKQFCFYYRRLAHDLNGNPMKDKDGRWVKEEVYTVDTLFTIKKVSDKEGRFLYYEIYPSSIFLDQLDSYFMLIPFDWREEVCRLVGKKKTSSYTFRFLFFLRYQHELLRRSKKEQPFIVRKSPEEVCISIKMPESVYRKKPKRANEILLDAYEVAKKLGYITDFQRKEVDVFFLNEQKYTDHKSISIQDAESEEVENATQEIHCYELFQKLRAEFDSNHTKPNITQKKAQLVLFKKLLEHRSLNDIETALKWSINRKYWSSFVTTPEDFAKNFDKIWAEILTKSEFSGEEKIRINKKKSHELLEKHDNKTINGWSINVLSKYVEFSCLCHCVCVNFDDADFDKKLNEALKKIGI